ncbi:MAG TPA: DUF6340 family protein [Bacteroidales bacterium]|nr:DUF6340 family protein [Bacteroidales bacterium]
MRLLSFVLTLLCLACYTNRITISVLQPSSVVLPKEIKKITIYPKPGYTPVKNRLDSLNEIQISAKTDVAQIKTGYLDGIYNVMSESPKFTKVVLNCTSYGLYMKDSVLFWDDLRKICTQDTTEYILLLQGSTVYDTELERESNTTYYGVYKMINLTKWAFLQPFIESIALRFTETDSLRLDGVFGGFGDTEYHLYRNCYTSGYLTGMKICPYWKDTLRTYFDGPGSDMKHASRLIKRNNWRAASLIWNDLSDGPNHSLASKAAFNMALAWEHGDDLDQALQWIDYADSLGNNKRIKIYRDILEKRLETKKLLDKQLP